MSGSSSALLCLGYFLVISYISQTSNTGLVQSFKLPQIRPQQLSNSKLFSDKKYESSKTRRAPGGRSSSSAGRSSGGRGGGRGRGRGASDGPKQDYRNKNSVGTTGRGSRRREDEGNDNTWMPISTKWRLFNIDVLLENDPGKDVYTVHEGLINSIQKSLGILIDTKKYLSSSSSASSSSSKSVWAQKGDFDDDDDESDFLRAKKASSNPADDLNTDNLRVKPEDITILRKAFDGRWKKFGQPKFVYTVDVQLTLDQCRAVRIKPAEGKVEALSDIASLTEHLDTLKGYSSIADGLYDTPAPVAEHALTHSHEAAPRVVVVGSGPSGLFAALTLAAAGLKPIILERGQAVERRGRDIGALFNRKILDPESNLCYGEGGAGTWSDGKLTTSIGKNSADVRSILESLVSHGAPEKILVDGKPHLGTDKLIVILRNIRAFLVQQGIEFRFGCAVDDIVVSSPETEGYAEGAGEHVRRITGLKLRDGSVLDTDLVVLAPGHSARVLYEKLIEKGVSLEPKPIAVGFRVEHPQELINRIQFGEFGELCERGKGKVPVADYRLAHEVFSYEGREEEKRACYSFCMCPGGQIVPTSVNAEELCVNGMSFSKRQSKWANSALVVSVTPEDMKDFGGDGPLRGVEWQRVMEKRAAVMGGGNLVAPVQRVTDFLDGIEAVGVSIDNPISSSYRMGVKEAPLHDLYPAYVTRTLREAILAFERRMPGFISPDAILHGVETRTSAPVQITRKSDTLECSTLAGLYPTGEGAGYAGGIVSAAVDGMKVGRSIVALINKKSGQSVARDVGKQLEQLAEGIENVTKKLSKEEAKVDQIVSYQAEAVYTGTGTSKTLEITASDHSEVAVAEEVAVAVAVAGTAVELEAVPKSAGVKSKTRSAFLKRLVTKKAPSA